MGRITRAELLEERSEMLDELAGIRDKINDLLGQDDEVDETEKQEDAEAEDRASARTPKTEENRTSCPRSHLKDCANNSSAY